MKPNHWIAGGLHGERELIPPSARPVDSALARGPCRGHAEALGRGVEVLFLATLLAGLAPVDAQIPARPRLDLWMVDGPVHAVAVAGDTAYLGGEFSYVGPRTRSVALFDTQTGARVKDFPAVNGAVYAAVPDGAGGWFLGGQFTAVGGVALNHLAHVRTDHSIDSGWDARVEGTVVNALRLEAGRLFVGGQFSRLGGVAQTGLGAVDPRDGARLAWDPGVRGTVHALGVGAGTVYVAGSFTSVGQVNRANLAEIDLETARVTDWKPNADHAVHALVVVGDTAYVGGEFASVGGKPRNRLAALDRLTGQASTWNPNPNGTVRALVVRQDVLYVGGDFTTVSAMTRRGLAGVDRVSGLGMPLDLRLEGGATATGIVRAIAEVDDTLLVGGSFTRVLGVAQPLVTAVSLTTGLPAAAPLGTGFAGAQDNAVVFCFGVDGEGGEWLSGGRYESLGGFERLNAVALSLITGEPLSWKPAPSGGVRAIVAGADAIYLGGSFTNVGGLATKALAAVDRGEGLALANWSVTVSNRLTEPLVSHLDLVGDRLVLGGRFEGVEGKPARHLAVIDARTGMASDFNAALTGGSQGLFAIARWEQTLYVAGDFTGAGGKSRARLAALDLSQGALVDWNPAPNQEVRALAVAGGRIYAGGKFTRIGGMDLRHLAAFDAVSHTLLPWDSALPTSSSGIAALAALDTVVYVAGGFSSIGGEFRHGVTALTSASARAQDWDPSPNDVPEWVAAGERFVWMGGTFRTVVVGGTAIPCGYVTAYERGARVESLDRVGDGLRLVAATGDRTRAVLQTSTDLVTWAGLHTNAQPGLRWTLDLPRAAVGSRFYRAIAE